MVEVFAESPSYEFNFMWHLRRARHEMYILVRLMDKDAVNDTMFECMELHLHASMVVTVIYDE